MAAPPAPQPRSAPFLDSSDEDSSHEAANSSDDEDAGATGPSPDATGLSPGKMADPTPTPPPPKSLKQSTLHPKLRMSEIRLNDPLVTAEAVAPPRSVENAASRFVLVPASQFESEGIGGWVACIKSVARGQQQVTTLAFKDADGKSSKQYFS